MKMEAAVGEDAAMECSLRPAHWTAGIVRLADMLRQRLWVNVMLQFLGKGHWAPHTTAAAGTSPLWSAGGHKVRGARRRHHEERGSRDPEPPPVLPAPAHHPGEHCWVIFRARPVLKAPTSL